MVVVVDSDPGNKQMRTVQVERRPTAGFSSLIMCKTDDA